MVIHDMRNPTNAIDFAIQEVLKLLEINAKGREKQKQIISGEIDNSSRSPKIRGKQLNKEITVTFRENIQIDNQTLGGA